MNVIFLDIDGVLCTWDSMKRHKPTAMVMAPVEGLNRNQRRRRFIGLCERSIANLNLITKASGACIVLSSTWRKGRIESFMLTVKYIKSRGVEADIIDRTPVIHHPRPTKTYAGATVSAPRGEEIQAWMDKATSMGMEIDNFVILDDDSDMIHLMDKLVKTSMETGIQDQHVEQALALLGVAPLQLAQNPSQETSAAR